MSLKHLELEINEENPFENCKLDRSKYAAVLTSIIENYSEGFVMAINNKWGTGKTTFVKMWEQSLKNSGYETIYFNAWENDFDNSPLTALIGELKMLRPTDNQNFKKVISTAAKLSKNIAPALVKAILNKYLDSEILVDTLTDSVKTGTEIFEDEIKEYADRKKSITDFRNELSQFVSKNSVGKPLIFIIDELDRCRPNYSVSLLEQVKHFFSVKNIVFVLSIDKEQLGNAICGVYNSDKIDSSEYLRRFIDIEYSIPEPKSGEFFNYLFDYFDYNSFFNSNERLQQYEFKYDKDSFVSTSKLLLQKCNLRELEKIMATTRMTLRSFYQNSYVMPVFYIYLIFIKFIHNSYYKNLISKNLTLLEAQNEFYNIIKPYLNNDNKRHFIQIEGLLLFYYNELV
ncbi:NTPase [Chryseobacterium balustinum]|uniref:KAP family P-loop domain-containing protein n=2 Tax=Chryseobacterium balustinum TaxID=246 RepID=A0AAX2IPB1_9FLAO|nr:NTPase [Chryseobacterium balustinum]SKC07844.1 KAP family P-loop domain-containing protein [Chryseobacterium balustinum]SQA91620.1 Predicted P-loop ATPase [Chryseobacterium balustinum]